jgi:hypothetical protein
MKMKKLTVMVIMIIGLMASFAVQTKAESWATLNTGNAGSNYTDETVGISGIEIGTKIGDNLDIAVNYLTTGTIVESTIFVSASLQMSQITIEVQYNHDFSEDINGYISAGVGILNLTETIDSRYLQVDASLQQGNVLLGLGLNVVVTKDIDLTVSTKGFSNNTYTGTVGIKVKF